MKLSAAKAAQEVGKSTATITRAIEKGKISAVKDANGAWEIDPAELFRVFSPATHRSPSLQRNANQDETGENKELSTLVKTLQEQNSDLRAERDSWRQQAERLALALPALNASARPSESTPPYSPVVEQGKPVGGFWARLWGKGAANS